MPNTTGLLRPAHVHATPLAVLCALADRIGRPAAVRGGDPAHILVTGLSVDSRLIRPGDAYVALAGTRTHGIRFAAAALAAGAVVVLTDPDGAADPAAVGLPVAAVSSPRTVMAHWAAEVYGRPAERLTMYGVTGTNGKTTTAALLAAGLAGAGHLAGTIGTLGFRIGDRILDGARTTITTPESVDLHALLAVMRESGADSVAMEVSSHAMVFQRAEAVPFAVAGFTNLGRDHLDFHHTMEAYFRAKAGLFTPDHTAAAVISVDDEWGVRLAAEARTRLPRVETTSFTDPSADWYTPSVTPTEGGSRVDLVHAGRTISFSLGMPGVFNARNAVTCAAMLAVTGVDLDAALPALASARVPGRMQIVTLDGPAPLVVVDFAHTPQAVASALRTLREDPGRRRLLAVLGCGGDRDRAKRGPMGEAAARSADVVVVTDDNPRTEAPASIRAQVLDGARRVAAERPGVDVLDGGDRASALTTALSMAGPGDTVAVLGKGHEQGQIVGDRVIPFDDVEAVRTAWRTLEENR